MIERGFPLSAWEDFTVGMLLNYARAYDRRQQENAGERVSDPDDQYCKLKAMQPEVEEMYRKGEIRPERYRSFMKSIEDYERKMEEVY